SVRAARAMALAASSGVPTYVRPAFQLGGMLAPAAFSLPPSSDVVPFDVGAALQSLVAPQPPVSAPGSVATSFGAPRPAPAPSYVAASQPAAAASVASQAPAQEVVRTASAPGVGDFQIPDWFEAAAKKMLAERGQSDDRFGLPELTLIGA